MRTLLFAGLLLISMQSFAQRVLWYEGSWDRPSYNLYWVYKPAFGNRIGYNFTEPGRETIEFGGFLGFNLWKPKQDTFYYHDVGNSYGKAIFSNYYIIQICLNAQRAFFPDKKCKPFAGIDFGYYYYTFEYEEHDSWHDLEGSVVEGRAAFCPRAGLQFDTDHIRIALQARYNFYISIGSTDPRATNFNPSAGKFDYFWSAGLILGYIHHKNS